MSYWLWSGKGCSPNIRRAQACIRSTLVKELDLAAGDTTVHSNFARKYCGLLRSGGR